MAGLSDGKLVMTWRAVSDLQNVKSGVPKTANWPEIGENSYAIAYDAGTMIVGYWVQKALFQKLAAEPPAPKTELIASNLLGARCCAQMSLARMALVSNPASQQVLSAPAPAKLLPQSNALEADAAALGAADKVDVVDQDGNFFSITKAAQPAAALAAAAAKPAANSFVGFNLMVSNLAASRKFYSDVLGLRPSGAASKTEATFTSGHITISLHQENAVGLVRSLRSSGRLNADWMMFAVKDIEATAKDLEKRGVKFPTGIEDSPNGRGAYFTDIDGHVLNLWVPPDKPDEINYLPVLKRLLG